MPTTPTTTPSELPAAAAADASGGARLFAAAESGDVRQLESLLQSASDEDLVWANEEGTSTLMVAAEKGHADVVLALLQVRAWCAAGCKHIHVALSLTRVCLSIARLPTGWCALEPAGLGGLLRWGVRDGLQEPGHC
jgi:ankyrin repeat protein